MNYYETLYIVHPALEAGRLKDIIMDIEGSLKKMGGDPLAIDLWGKRKLAYFINKQKYGTYVLIQYNGEGNCTHDFALELDHNSNILAYLTTNIDRDDVIEQEKDLETQIAGTTREDERKMERIEKHGNKEPAVVIVEEKVSDSSEVINKEKSSDDGGKQTDSETKKIKVEESEKVVSEEEEKNGSDLGGNVNLPIEDGNEQIDVVVKPETTDKKQSNEENSSEEKADDSTVINEKE